MIVVEKPLKREGISRVKTASDIVSETAGNERTPWKVHPPKAEAERREQRFYS
jgi:hypothetical protein